MVYYNKGTHFHDGIPPKIAILLFKVMEVIHCVQQILQYCIFVYIMAIRG